MRFQEKNVVVAGGGGGMGSAICLAFAGEGADVAVLDLDINNAERAAGDVAALGLRCLALKVDLSIYTEVTDAIEKVLSEFEHIDILINAAGIPTAYLPFSELPEEVWDESIAVNLKGVFNPTRAVINHMIERKYGKIVSISSAAGDHGSPNHAQYAAAKAGIFAMSKSIAMEVASLGININVIAPGAILTPFTDKVDKVYHKKVMERTLVGRYGTTDEIAALTLFLASEDANFIVGQVISPSGGWFI